MSKQSKRKTELTNENEKEIVIIKEEKPSKKAAVFLKHFGVSLPEGDGSYQYFHYKQGDFIAHPEFVQKLLDANLPTDVIRFE